MTLWQGTYLFQILTQQLSPFWCVILQKPQAQLRMTRQTLTYKRDAAMAQTKSRQRPQKIEFYLYLLNILRSRTCKFCKFSSFYICFLSAILRVPWGPRKTLWIFGEWVYRTQYAYARKFTDSALISLSLSKKSLRNASSFCIKLWSYEARFSSRYELAQQAL